MDPNATLNQIIAHIEAGEIDEAEVLVDALIDWLDRGGFAPTGHNKDTILEAINAAARLSPN